MSVVKVDNKRWRVKVFYHPFLSIPTLKGVKYIDSGDQVEVTRHLSDQEVKDIFVMAKSQGTLNSDAGLDKGISNADCYICRAERSGLTSPSLKINSLGGHMYECYRGKQNE